MAHKTALSAACYALDPDAVRGLLADGARADGADGDRWRGSAPGCLDGAPFYTPLGEACRSDRAAPAVRLDIVRMLLAAGAPVDGRDYRSETPLHLAAQHGFPQIVDALVAAGADVDAVGINGTPLIALMTLYLPRKAVGPKGDALRALLAADADVRARDIWGKTLVDRVAALGPDDGLTKATTKALVGLMQIIGEHDPDWAELTAWLDEARLQAEARALQKREKEWVKLSAKVEDPAFEARASRAIGSTATGRREILKRVTEALLCAPAVVAHPGWGRLIVRLLELTPAYGDVTEDVYGERLDASMMADDEGGVLDMYTDDALSTIDLCLVACRAPGAAERADFADIVRAIAEGKQARVGDVAFGDDEAVALASHLGASGHPQAAALAQALERGFPWGDWP